MPMFNVVYWETNEYHTDVEADTLEHAVDKTRKGDTDEPVCHGMVDFKVIKAELNDESEE